MKDMTFLWGEWVALGVWGCREMVGVGVCVVLNSDDVGSYAGFIIALANLYIPISQSNL